LISIAGSEGVDCPDAVDAVRNKLVNSYLTMDVTIKASDGDLRKQSCPCNQLVDCIHLLLFPPRRSQACSSFYNADIYGIEPDAIVTSLLSAWTCHDLNECMKVLSLNAMGSALLSC
jgi:hypothetical protein